MADDDTIRVDSDDDEYNSSMNTSCTSQTLNVRMNRSGYTRKKHIGVDAAIQSDPAVPDRPKLSEKEKISTNEIKLTCAKLSSTCGVSVEMSRKIVQVVRKELYNHDVYLSATEQLAGECDIVAEEPNVNQEDVSVSPSVYKKYKYVLPSARTIADYKQILASEMETEAARMLYEKDPSVKAIMHFDTTSRSSIDGDFCDIL